MKLLLIRHDRNLRVSTQLCKPAPGKTVNNVSYNHTECKTMDVLRCTTASPHRVFVSGTREALLMSGVREALLMSGVRDALLMSFRLMPGSRESCDSKDDILGSILAVTLMLKVFSSEVRFTDPSKSPSAAPVSVTLMGVCMPAARGPVLQDTCRGGLGRCRVKRALSRDTFSKRAVFTTTCNSMLKSD